MSLMVISPGSGGVERWLAKVPLVRKIDPVYAYVDFGPGWSQAGHFEFVAVLVTVT